jgi:hypothetical protein
MMLWEIRYEESDQVVRVKTSGTMTLPPLKRMVAETLAEAASHNGYRFLMDHRDVIVKLSMAEIYALPAIFKVVGRATYHRVAILYPQGTETRAFHFHEYRAQNLGFLQRIFSASEPALAWLAEADQDVAKTL